MGRTGILSLALAATAISLIATAVMGLRPSGADETVSNIATKETPALLSLPDQPQDGKPATALEVTVKPTRVIEGALYMVQVYAGPAGASAQEIIQDKNLVGTFAPFPAREGETRSFVVPPPAPANGEAGEIAVRLVPAHPQRDLGATALEVLGAQLVE